MRRQPSLAARMWNNLLAQYVVASLLVAAALVIARMLVPRLGDSMTYVTLFPAIAFAAWFGGLGPAIVSVALALATLGYGFIPPGPTLANGGRRQALGMIVFLMAAVIFIAMGEARRRHNGALRLAQGELEERIRQRTSELDAANQDLRELTARLLQLQDDERRRIARELHDSIGQILAALTMNLSAVKTDIERLNHTASTVSDSLALAQEMSQEVRTVSYLLHPPLLDEAGLLSALRWYLDGFSQRSKIKVDLEIAENFGRLPQELETALFRTVQECLTNIHRHSGSPVARIRLVRSPGEVYLQVDDRGSGIPAHKLDEMKSAGTPGVGIRGMRERLRQLGGSLEIHSGDSGTSVSVRLPVAAASKLAA
jgi:signal transduction histidine kinase